MFLGLCRVLLPAGVEELGGMVCGMHHECCCDASCCSQLNTELTQLDCGILGVGGLTGQLCSGLTPKASRSNAAWLLLLSRHIEGADDGIPPEVCELACFFPFIVHLF